ncbi:ribitol-5-phosphate dehydrogenase [Bacillus capparidis]|uniref:Ribulose-5-phosphate reductase n=1 Tax=Bacillus capparidis TaxID=1840411 RepID=A0ABS4CV87_9BACI|nr:ribitol-5-phosphate dehydrogenase [Bacillus capparidis]MBP1081442.1 ribitol-5-phosphate 2-dehydrogenase [Bacillus capparidis]MED1096113.1 ribitol-5-phosphate dehydrogenase [Bacillus capparidis]
MINQTYRLVSARQFEVTYKDKNINANKVVVRPTHLSICAADQRYYTGTRGKEAMDKKLPMALIHEGIGKVMYDPTGTFEIGTYVVMVPNLPTEQSEIIAENYLRTSKFRSSGYDGFMQDYMFMDPDRLVQLPTNVNPKVAAFTELITITIHALSRFERIAHKKRDTFGVWGDGNLGFITALILKKKYPDSKVIIFGKTPYKLEHFSFVDETYQINDIPEHVMIDHAFECVGGRGSESAIEQIIEHVHPEASVALLGVSEYPVEVSTRLVLEKGITLIGSSRSGREDFVRTVNFLSNYPEVVEYLETLVGDSHPVRCIDDIIKAFEADLTSSWGKTVLEWEI